MAQQGKLRTCVVCRNNDTKGSLLRIVRTPEGSVEFDSKGKMNGRGAYVCSVTCFEKAVKTKRFDSALRTKVTQEDYERITNQLIAYVSDNTQ